MAGKTANGGQGQVICGKDQDNGKGRDRSLGEGWNIGYGGGQGARGGGGLSARWKEGPLGIKSEGITGQGEGGAG